MHKRKRNKDLQYPRAFLLLQHILLGIKLCARHGIFKRSLVVFFLFRGDYNDKSIKNKTKQNNQAKLWTVCCKNKNRVPLEVNPGVPIGKSFLTPPCRTSCRLIPRTLLQGSINKDHVTS